MEQPGDTLWRDLAACRKSTSLSFTYTSFRQPAAVREIVSGGIVSREDSQQGG
jgi:hypothetical protein